MGMILVEMFAWLDCFTVGSFPTIAKLKEASEPHHIGMLPATTAVGVVHLLVKKSHGVMPMREVLTGGNQLVTGSVACPIAGTADSAMIAAR